MAKTSYYEITNGQGEKHFITTEADDRSLETVLDASGGALATPAYGAAAAPPKSYAYRKMGVGEFEQALKTGKMPGLPPGQNPRTGEKWFTESLQHSRAFQNKGVKSQEVVAEFGLKRNQYKNISSKAIPQKGSRANQPKEGLMHNIFNREQLRNHPKGKKNIGLKGKGNIDIFNEAVVSVKKVDPHSFMNKNSVLRWIRRNKYAVAATTISVALDAAAVVISVIDDNGNFGDQTKITLAEIGGGMGGSAIATAVASALISTIPIVGQIAGLIGGLIGMFLAGGITRFWLSCGQVAPGPGLPVLETDPYESAYGVPSIGVDTGFYGQPSEVFDTGAIGMPKTSFDASGYRGFPDAGYKTRGYHN